MSTLASAPHDTTVVPELDDEGVETGRHIGTCLTCGVGMIGGREEDVRAALDDYALISTPHQEV